MPAYKLPYDDSGPMPGSGVDYANGVVLLDPATGDPITPASGSSGGGAAPATGTVANVAVTATSQIALAANTGRLGAIFVNDGPNIAYVLLSTTGPATSNTCSVILQPGASFVLNKGDYTGNVHMVGNVAGGTFRVTEFTA